MDDGLKLFADIFALDSFDEVHFRVQLIERFNAPLQDRQPFPLGSTPSEFEQCFHRVGHHSARSEDGFRWRIVFPVREKPMLPKLIERYSLQMLFTLSAKLTSVPSVAVTAHQTSLCSSAFDRK